jgi:signal peptidase I
MTFNKVITYVFFVIVIFVASLLALSRYDVFGIHVFYVRSGSMEPTIKTGSLVVDKAHQNYYIDDIVTYYNRENHQETITHRIIEVSDEAGIEQITTKGDANDVADAIPITSDLIVGKVAFSIPYLGYVVGAARTTVGFIFLIIIPVTIIVYEEIRKIHHETKHIIRKRKEKKLAKSQEKEKSPETESDTQSETNNNGGNDENS